jgi:hypothetical protein
MKPDSSRDHPRFDILGIRRRVEHAKAFELFDAGDIKPAVAHPAGDDDGLAATLVVSVEARPSEQAREKG